MKIIYTGPIFTVARDKVRFSDGHSALFDFVFHKPAAAVVPFFPETGSILMVRQPRFAVKRKLWEIPAGLIEKGESPAHAARRELEEETGFRAGRLIKLKTVFSSPGFTDETTHLYLALDLKRTQTSREKDEEIEIKEFPVSVLLKEFAARPACDAKSILAVHLALARMKLLKYPESGDRRR